MSDEREPLLKTESEKISTAINYNITSHESPDSKNCAADVPLLKSFRKYIVIICTASMIVMSASMSSMSSALVCIVPVSGDNDTDAGTNYTSNHTLPDWRFNWSKQSQGWALSCFYMGFFISQFPAGIAATKWGPKRILVVMLLLISVFQVLTVPAAYYGLPFLYADRVLAGIIAGFLYAPTYAVLGQWAPKPEASLLFALVGSGMEFGNMMAFVISTFSCEIPIQGGWPFIFYILGAMGLLTSLASAIFISASPFTNKFLSKKELQFISGSVPKQQKKEGELSRVPVKAIVTSMPVWAIVVSQLGTNWFFYQFVNVSPQFMKEVLKFSELQTNLVSGFPFIFSLAIIFPCGYISDRLVTKGIITNTTLRKMNDFVCKVMPTGALIGLAFLPEGAFVEAFVLNIIIATTLAFAFVSWMANPIDLAPAYTGFVVGFCQGCVLWVAVVVPILVDTITKNKTRSEWQLAFFITAGLQVVTHIFYLFFASGELQPWALSSYAVNDDDDDVFGDDSTHPRSRSSSRASRMSISSFINESRSRWSFLDASRARSAIAWGIDSDLTSHLEPRSATENDVTRQEAVDDDRFQTSMASLHTMG